MFPCVQVCPHGGCGNGCPGPGFTFSASSDALEAESYHGKTVVSHLFAAGWLRCLLLRGAAPRSRFEIEQANLCSLRTAASAARCAASQARSASAAGTTIHTVFKRLMDVSAPRIRQLSETASPCVFLKLDGSPLTGRNALACVVQRTLRKAGVRSAFSGRSRFAVRAARPFHE